uniref:Uncharacterized protein n=1 Tax=Anguilla anguilla TaxID=7936 RepID=A0A0E9XHF7_ANGAN
MEATYFHIHATNIFSALTARWKMKERSKLQNIHREHMLSKEYLRDHFPRSAL